MSFGSLEAVYEGIASQLDANRSLTIALAVDAVNYVPNYLAKKQAGLQKVQDDVQQYLLASLDFSSPSAPAKAAQWSQQKNMDTTIMDTGTSELNNLIENFKSDAQINEVNLQTAIGMQVPINSLFKSMVSLIPQMGF